MRIPAIWVRWKAPENPDIPVKGPRTDLLAHTHPGLCWRVSSSGGTRDIWRKTELCGLSARPGGIAAIAPLSTLLPVYRKVPPGLRLTLPPPHMANSEATLASEIGPPHSTHKLPKAGLLLGSQSCPVPSLGCAFIASNSSLLCSPHAAAAAHTFQGKLWVVGHWHRMSCSVCWADHEGLRA